MELSTPLTRTSLCNHTNSLTHFQCTVEISLTSVHIGDLVSAWQSDLDGINQFPLQYLHPTDTCAIMMLVLSFLIFNWGITNTKSLNIGLAWFMVFCITSPGCLITIDMMELPSSISLDCITFCVILCSSSFIFKISDCSSFKKGEIVKTRVSVSKWIWLETNHSSLNLLW